MKLLISFLIIFSSTAKAEGLDYLKNGKTIPVKIDTVTPANSNPYPVINYGNTGNPVDFATEATLGLVEINTEATSIYLSEAASGVTPFKVQQVVPANGSYAEITNLTTTAQTFTAPANAVGFVIEALSDNTQNIRYKIGAAATTTSGMRLEPGRSENFNQGPAANVSVCAEGGTNQVVTIQWVVK